MEGEASPGDCEGSGLLERTLCLRDLLYLEARGRRVEVLDEVQEGHAEKDIAPLEHLQLKTKAPTM